MQEASAASLTVPPSDPIILVKQLHFPLWLTVKQFHRYHLVPVLWPLSLLASCSLTFFLVTVTHSCEPFPPQRWWEVWYPPLCIGSSAISSSGLNNSICWSFFLHTICRSHNEWYRELIFMNSDYEPGTMQCTSINTVIYHPWQPRYADNLSVHLRMNGYRKCNVYIYIIEY